MRNQCRPGVVFLRDLLCLFVVFLFLAVLSNRVAAYGQRDAGVEHIVLTGSFDGQFNLDPNDCDLLRFENMAPGDSRVGQIWVTNSCQDKMELSLVSIKSRISDLALFNTLDLSIAVAGIQVYSGKYGATHEPITNVFTIEPDETLIIDVRISLPLTADNSIANKVMDSVWTFEARYDGYVAPQTGVDLFVNNIREGADIWIYLLMLVCGLFIAGRLFNTIRHREK